MLSNLLLGTFIWGAVPLVAAVLCLLIGWLGLRQRREAGERDHA
jgi:hypothetical protein